MSAFIHPTAMFEDGVVLGPGTSIWDNVHIRRDARIGEQCIVGEKTYIAYEVSIGNRVKINAMVYICAEVTIEDGVMISAGVVFTNDRFPRAKKTIVFGSGVGFGSGIPRVDDSWTFYCVRGPRSAHALGLPAALAITDPALLIADLLPTETTAPRRKAN